MKRLIYTFLNHRFVYPAVNWLINQAIVWLCLRPMKVLMLLNLFMTRLIGRLAGIPGTVEPDEEVNSGKAKD